MTTTIIRTNKQTVEIIKNDDGTIQVLNSTGISIQNPGNFITSMGGVDAILSKCEEIEGTFADFMQGLRDMQNHQKEVEAEKRKNLVPNAYAVMENEDSTVQEVFQAFQSIRKIDTGWFATEKAFLDNKRVKEFLLSKIGSYTATPFDNGEVIIKAENSKFSNKRHAGYDSLYDLFEITL